MPTSSGLAHVALTVTDLAVSVPFYADVLGAPPATTMTDGPLTRRVFALPGGQGLGLTRHDAAGGGRFDATTPGLDHVGFACAGRDDVVAWAEHLDSVGVPHRSVQAADCGWALSFTDHGTALEFFASACPASGTATRRRLSPVTALLSGRVVRDARSRSGAGDGGGAGAFP